MNGSAAKALGSDALLRAASEVEISLLSEYPERRRQFLQGAGRITVDAREKDKLTVKMRYLTF